jgi:competence protein ComEA
MQRGAEGQRLGDRIAAMTARLITTDRMPGLLAQQSGQAGEPDGAPGRAVRWSPSRKVVVAALVVAALSCVGAGAWVARDQPRQIAAAGPQRGVAAETGEPPSLSPGGSLKSPLASAAATASSGGPAGRSNPSGAAIVVDVVGKVQHPGVYRLPVGSRVDDAIKAAGGGRPGVDFSVVNLARKLADGEQVAVGVPGAGTSGDGVAAPSQGSVSGQGGGGSSATPLDLNLASLKQLDGLPGVGPVLAQRIIDWRTAHGRFDSVDQLNAVSGIGDAKFADLRPLVTVG